MDGDSRRIWMYLSADVNSPEHASVRVAVFAVASIASLVLSVTLEPNIGFFAAFCAFASLVWMYRWRRRIRMTKQSASTVQVMKTA